MTTTNTASTALTISFSTFEGRLDAVEVSAPAEPDYDWHAAMRPAFLAKLEAHVAASMRSAGMAVPTFNPVPSNDGKRLVMAQFLAG